MTVPLDVWISTPALASEMVWAAPAGSSTLTEEMLLLSAVGMMVMVSAADAVTASTAFCTAASSMTAV